MAVIGIDGRKIGDGQPCYIIAEGGVNHNGSVEVAKRLIDAAKKAGSDAIKFQSFKADAIAVAECPTAPYQAMKQRSQREMLRRLEVNAADLTELAKYAGRRRITLLSSPFDLESVDDVDAAGIPAFKVGSGEITNFPLLERIAEKGKPVLLSTGMATIGEIQAAIKALESKGAPAIALLHCVSEYPSNPKDANLLVIRTLRERFGLPTGFSDHSIGPRLPIAAVCVGACIVEKHMTLDKRMRGPDHKASMEPREFASMIEEIRAIELALGNGTKKLTPGEIANRDLVRKSVVASAPISAGGRISLSKLTTKRPGTGIQPASLPLLEGAIAKRDIGRDEMIEWEDVEIACRPKGRRGPRC